MCGTEKSFCQQLKQERNYETKKEKFQSGIKLATDRN